MNWGDIYSMEITQIQSMRDNIPFNDNLKLSLKGLLIYSHIRTQLLDILSVHSFHVECVMVLSRV